MIAPCETPKLSGVSCLVSVQFIDFFFCLPENVLCNDGCFVINTYIVNFMLLLCIFNQSKEICRNKLGEMFIRGILFL